MAPRPIKAHTSKVGDEGRRRSTLLHEQLIAIVNFLMLLFFAFTGILYAVILPGDSLWCW
ncbi:MAG: hypothetical protein HC837_14745 [Chloroflexaceae bacterium]|nr:hypothetical protein [Chloroflexaceae bacterium]